MIQLTYFFMNERVRMDTPLHREHVGAFTIEIYRDENPEDPREYMDYLGTIVYKKDSRYLLGHEAKTSAEMDQISNSPDYITLPVYAYIHGNVVLNTTGFTCPWDSGQSGFIYVAKEKVRNEYEAECIDSNLRKKVQKVLKSEVETFSDILSGNVYGYRVLDEDGEEVYSCWGFVGDWEYCLEEAKETIPVNV